MFHMSSLENHSSGAVSKAKGKHGESKGKAHAEYVVAIGRAWVKRRKRALSVSNQTAETMVSVKDIHHLADVPGN